MKRRELSDKIVESDADFDEIVECLQKFNVGEFYEKNFLIKSYENPIDTEKMTNYIEGLKREGLDIGKGDCQFGYKMPLPKNGAGYRSLQIFRRK